MIKYATNLFNTYFIDLKIKSKILGFKFAYFRANRVVAAQSRSTEEAKEYFSSFCQKLL